MTTELTMTPFRAAALLRRFKHDEQMLGPNEQAAIDFAISAITALTTSQPAQAVQREAWVPYLVDRADGVKGHYAIGRWNPRGYREVWNLHSHQWAAYSDDVMSLEEADSLLRQITIPTVRASLPTQPAAQATPEDMKVYDGIAADYFAETQQATPEPLHLFEFWWESHMPQATQSQAWAAWTAAQNSKGATIDAAQATQQAAGEPVAWSPALNYPGYGRERVWANGKPRQEDIDYWQKNGDGITYAYTHPAPGVPEVHGVQWFTVAEHGMPDFDEEVIGGLWYTDPWLKPKRATRFMWGLCRVVKDDHRDFKDGKRWQTFGPSHNDITHWARLNMPALAAAQAKGADPEDLAAAGVMLMGRRADHA